MSLEEKLSHAPQLCPEDTMEDIRKKAVAVRPSRNQLAWHELDGYAAFVHFGVNTFTDREWGDGTEDPAIFNPTDFDAEEMISIIKDGGMKMAVLTCKHHDGFCLWPSKYTDHSVASSPYKGGKGDIVKEFSDACHKLGIRFGVYLSPWDRHDFRYGDSPAYNDYYINQLTELLTQYGEVSDVWLDGACAEGPNGKKQEYDWRRIYATVHELAPNATISSVGPDVRWCGNEAGRCRESEWNVIPVANTDEYLSEYSETTATAFTRHNCQGHCQNGDLGSLQVLKERAAYGDRLYWYPAQVDLSIRPGWFYHDTEDISVHTVEALLDFYMKSAGGNAQLLLNLPPNKQGRIHPIDAQRVRSLGRILRDTFAVNMLEDAALTADAEGAAGIENLVKDGGVFSAGNQKTVTITAEFSSPKTFDLICLRENIANGQRIEAVEIFVLDEAGEWKQAAKTTVVGSKRLVRIPETQSKGVRIAVTQSRDVPELTALGVYKLPKLLASPKIFRDPEGMVHIDAASPAKLYYTTDGGAPDQTSALYKEPFFMPESGTVRVQAVYPPEVLQDAVEVSEKETGMTFGVWKKNWKVVSTSGKERNGQSPDCLLEAGDETYVVAETGAYEVVLEMDRPRRLTGLLYQPVTTDPDFHHNCTAAQVAVSMDGNAWTEIPEVLKFDNIYHNPKLTVCPFEKTAPEAKFVKVTFGYGLQENTRAVAEIGFLSE